jgi:hypothetical protein
MLMKRCVCQQEHCLWTSLYFEQNLIIVGIIQHTVALDIAIAEINKKMKVQTNINAFFI